MKKKFSLRILLPAILVAVLVAGMLAVSGSNITSSDPLVSLSYLTGTYKTEIMSGVQAAIDQKASQVEKTLNGRISGITSASGFQPAVTATHSTANIPAGSSYTVPGNAEFLFLSGSVAAGGAGLVDLTEGTVVAIGAELTANHLYTATASVILRAGQTARILIRK